MTKTRKAKSAPSANGSHAAPAAANPLQAKFAAARAAMCATLVERDAEIDLVLTALIAGEHVLLVGPPGTAKSLLLDTVMSWVGGSGFKYLMTKFTEPDEIYGPTNLAGLKEGKYDRVMTGMLPEAEFAFLDEVMKASSAILNTLLTLLNERTVQLYGKDVKCPLRLCVAASNEWPNDDNGGTELNALFDRFLFRKTVKPVSPSTGRRELLRRAVANDDCRAKFTDPVTALELDRATQQARVLPVSTAAKNALLNIMSALDKEGIGYGDRRQYKTIKAIRAYAWLQGATEVQPAHLEILQHVLWEDPIEQPAKAAKIILKLCNPEQVEMETIEATCNDVMDKCQPAEAVVKLQDEAVKAARLCGIAGGMTSHFLATSNTDALLAEAAKDCKNAKAVRLLKFVCDSIRTMYRKSIGQTNKFAVPDREEVIDLGETL